MSNYSPLYQLSYRRLALSSFEATSLSKNIQKTKLKKKDSFEPDLNQRPMDDYL